MSEEIKPRTYVALILDKSGSMASTKQKVISGYNEQIQQLKEDAKTQEILCSVISFNGDVFEHLWNVPAEELVEASADSYVPNGGTALRDAQGYVIQKLINTTDFSNPNNSYLICSYSDGETNSDRHFDIPVLREMIDGCRANKNWTFTYMGCTEHYLKEISRQTGVPMSNMAAWSNSTDEKTETAFKNAASRQKKYFMARGMGSVGSSNYASDDISCVADYSEAIMEETPIKAEDLNLEVLKAVDLSELAGRMPKYEDQAAVTLANNEKVFAHSNKVKWSS